MQTLIDLSTADAAVEDLAHLVPPPFPGADADVVVLQARLTGTPVQAACGAVYVPSGNAATKRVCEVCAHAFEFYRSMGEIDAASIRDLARLGY